MSTTEERRAMRRALDLAARGPQRDPNPRVGAVVLDAGGTPIAEGWHRGAGSPHAEVAALAALPPGRARGGTLVVTLEPCAHTGRTGPCTSALLAAGISRVVYGSRDPGRSSGGGAEILSAAGVQVEGGVLVRETEAMLDGWLDRRPVVTVKWASTTDGRVAAEDGTSRWITGEEARRHAHGTRATVDAVVVGTGTVLADDPALTARGASGLAAAQPLPVVVGRRAVPRDAAVRRHPRGVMTDDGRDLPQLLSRLGALGVRSALVEGGPTLTTAFLRAGLVDVLHVYLAPALLGGPRLAVGDLGIPTVDGALRLRLESVQRLGDDVLLTLTPPQEGL